VVRESVIAIQPVRPEIDDDERHRVAHPR
jgi:hypothetical protein